MSSLQQELKSAQSLIENASVEEAVSKLQFLQKKYPTDIGVLNLLGQVYLRQKNYQNAVTCLEKSLRYKGKDAMIAFFLALSYEGLDQRQKALEFCKKSVAIDNKFGLGYYNLARMLTQDGQNIHAIHFYNEALKNNYCSAEVYAGLACMENEIGLWKEASVNFMRAYELTKDKKYLSSPIFIAQKDPTMTLLDMKNLAIDYYNQILKPIESNKKYDHTAKLKSNKSTLKVGFISGDFRTHPVGNNFKSVIQRLDKFKFEVFLYYTDDLVDAVTNAISQHAKAFHMVKTLDDGTIADLVYQDEIDILIDLSGFTHGEKLEVLALKPAPLQITHLGFPGTLGMPQIDFIIADKNVVKEAEEQYYVEKVYKMPCVFTHCDLFEQQPDLSELPYKRNGHITFGSLNTLHKITLEVIRTWSQILNQVPNSKLIIDSKALKHSINQEYIWARFAECGIDKSRITIKHSEIRKVFLENYYHIDIALDPFPYTGGTSTMESLMFGVPLVTIAGNKWVSRMSASKLNGCGHPELIAENIPEYINKYINLALDVPRLENYRQTLQRDMLNSGMQVDAYVKDFENALLEMWGRSISCFPISK